MRLISDAMLARAIRGPVASLRLWAARKAAARALHAPALAGAPDDPAVLAMLGLWQAALDAPAFDGPSRAGRLVAGAALGDAVDGAEIARLDPRWRFRLAAAIAPLDPRAAAALLPVKSLEGVACGYASEPRAGVPTSATGPEADLLRAGAAIAKGEDGREPFNAAFGAFGLSPPAGDRIAIERLAGDPGPAIDGPLVTVIMPLHQGEATVGWAIRSLLRQSWRNLEIVVVDDRSADAGPAAVADMACSDGRVRLVTNRREPGVYGARNTGLDEASGAFVAFLDADDWAHPQRIARQMARLGEGVATVSKHFRMGPDGRPVAPRVFPILRLCPISMLVRREVIEAVGGFLVAQTGADAELLARLDWLYGRRRVPRDPAPLTVASWRPNSLSSDTATGMLTAERSRFREQWMRDHARRWLAGEGAP